MNKLGFVIGLVLFSTGAVRGAVLAWNNPAGGNWNDPLNWTPNQVPGAGDSAIISANGSYSVAITDARTVLNLTVGGGSGSQTLEISGTGVCSFSGTMDGPGLVRVLGVLNWESGTMSGPGTTEIASGGTMNLNTATGKSLNSSRVVNNAGTIAWNGTGALTGTSAPVINNRGVLDLTADSTLNWGFSGGVPVVNNLASGTIRKSGGAGTFTFQNLTLNHSGTFDAQSGNIDVLGVTVNANTGSTFIGSGTALTRLVGSTLTAADGQTPGIGNHFELASGTFTGPGTISITGEMTWSGGSMSAAGTIRVESGAVLLLSGSGTKQFDNGRVIENRGLMRHVGSGGLSGSGAPQILNFGEYRIENDSSISWAFSGGRPVIDNRPGAVLGKTAGSGVFDFSNASVNNAGTVEAQIGTIRLNGGGTESGLFTAVPGAAVEFSSGTFDCASGTSFSGLGTHRLNGGTINISLTTIATLTAGTRFEFSSGTLRGVGEMEVSGTMIWTAGDMSEAGTTRIMSGATLELVGGGGKSFGLGRVIENNGLVRWTGIGTLAGYSSPTFANNGELRMETDSAFNWAFSGGVPVFNNNASGLVTKTAGAGAFSFDNTALFKRGPVRVESGQMRFNSGATCSGQFTASAGARIEFAGGTHTFDGNSSWDGAGTYAIQATVAVNDGFAVAANGLVQFTGTIRGLGTFLVNGQMGWSSGDMSEAGTTRIASGATLELAGGGGKSFGLGRVIENDGLVRWTGSGTLAGYSTPTFANNNTVRVEADSAFNWAFSGGVPVFNNNASGLIVKTAGVGQFKFDNCFLNNDGTVQADAGTLAMNADGTSTGAFVASAGGTLEQLGRTQTDTGGELRVLAGGTARISGGTFRLTGGGTLTSPGALQIAGGTLELDAAVNASVAGTFGMSAGTLRGTGTLALQGTGTWNSGDMSEAGTTRIMPGATLELAGGGGKSFGLGRVIENNGLVRWTGSSTLAGYSAPTFANNGELRIETDSAFNWAFSGGVPVFNNNASGLIVKTAGASAFSFDNTALFKRGPVRVESGQMRFNSSATCSGQFTALAGARMEFAGGIQTFDGNSTWDGTGTYALLATVSVNEGSTVNADGLVELTGSIGGLGTFLISQRTVWSTGTMFGAGITRIAVGGTLEMTGNLGKSFDGGRTIDNLGTMRWLGSGTLYGTGGSQLNNRGLLHPQVDGVLDWGFSGARPQFNNFPSGTILIGASGPASAQIAELFIQNTIVQLGGTLQVDLLGGYSPSINDSLTVIPLAGNSVANYGTFATILPLVFGTGLKFEPHYELAQVRLVTVEAPQTTITQHPVSATVECGNNHTFSVTATGSGTLTYQWRHNGVNIAGANGPTFTLSPARSSDAGTYDVVVTDSSTAAISNPATLNVSDTQPPTMTCPLDIVTSAPDLAGATVTFVPTASDPCDLAPTVTCSPASGSVFPVGTTAVNCTARDAANRTANCAFTVTVYFCEEFSFTVNQVIPDNDATGLTSTKTVASPIISLVDVNVLLKVTGGRNGDLHARLTHSSGTSFLLNRVGKTAAAPAGYSEAGLDALLDDQATTGDVHLYQLQPFTNPLTGTWQPDGRSTDALAVLDTDPRNALLDQFNGLNPSGTWTLVIADRAANNEARLLSWGLQLCGAKDTTAPTIVACAPAASIDANATCTALVPDLTGQVNATDDSGVAPTITQSPAAGTTVGLGGTQITFSVRDLAGNTAACVTTLTARDVTPPTITTCPPNQTVPATSGCDAPLPNLVLLAAATDCSGAVTLSQDPVAGTLLGPGLHAVTIRARDAAGNESTCGVAVTVTETTAPVIASCAPPTSLNANASCQAALPDLRSQVAATDCNLPLTITQTPPAGTLVGIGSHTINFVVRDAGGNQANCSSVVTVVDVTKPVITACAANRTVSAGANCAAIVPDLRSEVVATDCNGPVLITQAPAPGASVGLGVQIIVLTARDAAGNTETCSATLTIQDTTAPVITACVLNQTLPGDASCSATLPDFRASLTATDCNEPLTITQAPAGGSALGLGAHTVTFTIRDAAGNTATCQATVTVQESIAPVITQCAPHQTLIAGANCTATAPDLTGVVQATDCDLPLSVTQAPAPGTPLGLGVNTITFTVRDAAGNAATCTTAVTVNDETVPTIVTCAPNRSAAGDASCHAPAPDLRSLVTATDCNGPLTFTQTPPPGELLATGTHPITIVVADAANNVISCTAQFTVTDTTPPVITTCPPARTLPGGAGCNTPLPDLRPELVASDCNGPLTIVQSPLPGALLTPGTHSVTLTVRDAAGNETQCSAAVTVDSSTGLAIASCAPNRTMAGDASCQAALPDLTGQVVTSSCSLPVTLTQNPGPGTVVGLGAHSVTLTARDNAGNTATCIATVTVTDETAPVIATCAPNQTISASAGCQGSVPNLIGSVVATDCNGPVTVTQSPTPGTSVGLGVTTVTLTARDGAGNTATCTATVTVRDETAPVIATCAENQIVAANANCQGNVPSLVGSVVATDCNGPVTIAQSPAAGAIIGLGVTAVTLTARDAAGNTATCTATVTVRDQTAPVFGATPNLTVPATSALGAVVTFAVTATDQCPGTAAVVCNPAPGTLFAVGTTTVQCTATDGAGNQASRSFTVTVTTSTLNRPPIARADLLLVLNNQPVTFPISALLRNDSDPDGQAVQFVGVDTASARGGVITVTGSQITYRQPLTGIPFPVGLDSFRYRITDGAGAPVSGLVNVLISRVPLTGIFPAAADSNDIFEVQRTVDFVQWTTLEIVPASSGPPMLLDSDPPAEKAFYRIIRRPQTGLLPTSPK